MNHRFECEYNIIKNINFFFLILFNLFLIVVFIFCMARIFVTIIYSNHLRYNNCVFGVPFLKTFYTGFIYDDKIIFFL